jgi:NitT/TauT family transport system substrate-binding protein
MKRIANEFSQAVFNLPWLVAQEEGLFAPEGLEVEFLRARQWDPTRAPEPDPRQVDPFWRHAPFEERAAAAFNACEWGRCTAPRSAPWGGELSSYRPPWPVRRSLSVPILPLPIPRPCAARRLRSIFMRALIF